MGIIVPGAHLPGDSYMPLLRAIQASYPGPLWVGATSDWLGDMPTPIEVTQQINKCLDAANAAGLSTDDVFMAGHSLGGVVLQSYIATHSSAARAVAFLGTWLPDLYSKDGPIGSNEYVVPIGTFIGELDGGGISYLRREVEETGLLSESDRMLSKTVLVYRGRELLDVLDGLAEIAHVVLTGLDEKHTSGPLGANGSSQVVLRGDKHIWNVVVLENAWQMAVNINREGVSSKNCEALFSFLHVLDHILDSSSEASFVLGSFLRAFEDTLAELL